MALSSAECHDRSLNRRFNYHEVDMMLKKLAFAGFGIAVVFSALLTGDTVKAQVLPQRAPYTQQGEASWYGPGFHGKKTASGERFDQRAMTAAHKRLPLGTMATVTNLENGRAVRVEINDRGPYVRGRILDVSAAAAERLGMKDDGTSTVRIEVDRQ